MKETKLSQEQILVINSNNNLKRYLSGLSVGKPEGTPQSALYNIKGKVKCLSPDQILKEWKEILIELENSSDEYEVEVFRFDLEQEAKYGKQGVIPPMDSVFETVVQPTFADKKVAEAFSSSEWAAAKRQVVKLLHRAGCKGLSPISYQRVVDDMRARDTISSNSGWPDYAKRRLPEVIKRAIEDAQTGRWRTYPAIALFRDYRQKVRLVWMFPMSTNLVEGSYYQPLQSIIGKSFLADSFFAPWKGFETVRKVLTSQYADKRFIAASDFKSTDANFTLAASLEVCSVLEQCFQPRYREGLRESIVHMHNIPLIVSSETMIEGEHGVASGSNWTNFIETIFDIILGEYVKQLDSYDVCYAIGDDMTWSSPAYDADFAVRLEEYGKAVGQTIKAEKTHNDPDKVVTLQRLIQRGYLRPDSSVRCVYPTVRALNSLVNPERMHRKKDWSKDMSAIRSIMILENCVDHPLYEQFVRFVCKGDPYLAVFSRKSSRAQEALYRKSKSISGLNITYNQEKRDVGISQFRTVALLATL